MSGNIYKVQLVVDVYYKDEDNIIDKETDRDDAMCKIQETVLNIVDHAEDEGLLRPDCGIKLVTWHSVVSTPTNVFADELPGFVRIANEHGSSKGTLDGI
jgi:hypothetical protein